MCAALRAAPGWMFVRVRWELNYFALVSSRQARRTTKLQGSRAAERETRSLVVQSDATGAGVACSLASWLDPPCSRRSFARPWRMNTMMHVQGNFAPSGSQWWGTHFAKLQSRVDLGKCKQQKL
eukprot:1433233-Rhodomonas_salina.1